MQYSYVIGNPLQLNGCLQSPVHLYVQALQFVYRHCMYIVYISVIVIYIGSLHSVYTVRMYIYIAGFWSGNWMQGGRGAKQVPFVFTSPPPLPQRVAGREEFVPPGRRA